MKIKKILLGLSSLALGASLVACNGGSETTSTTITHDSKDMDVAVDANDDKVSQTYYAAPNVNIEYDFDKELNEEAQDKPTHAGTLDDPMDIYTAFHTIGAGDTLYLLPGTYKTDNRITLSQSGNAKRHIKVRNYTDDTHKGMVTLDFSAMEFLGNNRGIQLTGSYWEFYGMDIKGAGDNGMYIAGSYNKIERCNFHENRDTGLQLGRASGNDSLIHNWPSNNLILNCTSYNNYDVETLGENADGFAAKLTVGEGNVFDGCIAYRNADDGWDMYAKVDSGNIGTITLLNCVAFENGFVLDKTTSNTKTKDKSAFIDSYASQNGDGNGFKLGGSSMEGDMILKNCMAFNNRMGGFADNSNPGTLQLFDCTSFNNSVYMAMTNSKLEIDQTGDTGDFGANDGECLNYAMARTEASYNTFEGCLSYVSNQTNETISYDNFDTYRGAASYSIFNTGKNKYTQITSPIDASSYKDSQKGEAFTGTLNDSSFKSVSLGITVKGNREIDTLYRNSDGSVNMGDFLALADESLLKFNNGKPIGCTLNKTSMDQYEHISWAVPALEGKNPSKDFVRVQGAIDVLEVMCNKDYVYQDVKLTTTINGLAVSWYSSDESVLSIGYDTFESVSQKNYIIGNVKRDRNEDKQVKLVATIALKDVVLTKTFDLTIKKENMSIGKIVGFENKYIVEQYSVFDLPEFIATDASSYSNNPLVKDKDYKITTTYQYAVSTNSDFYTVDNVYTSVAGVYKVTGHIQSLANENEKYEVSYLVYVLSPNATIDLSSDPTLAETYGISMTDELAYQVNATRDGAKVSAAFTNIYGYMYIATSTEATMSKEDVIKNGTKVEISDEYAEGIAPNDNVADYNVFMVVTNRAQFADRLVVSNVYKASIKAQTITTAEELFNIITKGSDSTTIYLLANDIDFAETTFDFEKNTQAFTGLLNGNGHVIKNITIEAEGKSKGANIFYKVKDGTIMNVGFENITIIGDSSDSDTGIIGNMNGGYISNVSLKNIRVAGGSGVAALVGHIAGGTNYISNVSLVNPLESGWIYGSKYFGGIVGNMQKETDKLKVQLYMEDIYVNAYIGNHEDKGYVGGIVGRNKNEFGSYLLDLNRCFFTGTVDTGYTYSGGIVGSVDSMAGKVRVTHCISDVLLIIKDTILDKSTTEIGQKNNSPIMGRFGYALDLCYFESNFGPYNEYHVEVNSECDNFYKNISSETFFKGQKYDLENTWIFVANEDSTGNCILRNAK